MSNGANKGGGSKSSFHFVAGLGSGVLSAALLQPIDLLKTRVQQSGHQSLRLSVREILDSPQGLRGLWRGTVPSALRTGFGSAIYFSSLNAIRLNAARVPFLATAATTTASTARPSHSSSLVRLSNTGNLLAGGVARAFAGFVLMPLTVIKVRYESSLYSYRSVASAGGDILKTEGLRGFFAGFGATALRDAPYAGLYVLFYEQAKRRLGSAYARIAGPEKDGPEETSSSKSDGNPAGSGAEAEEEGRKRKKRMGVSRAAAINFTSGALAAALCSAVSNPFDAVKTRIQLQPGRYRNMGRAAARMVAEEGFRSLWSGLALRMGRKALSSALAWTLYEELIMRAEVSWAAASSSSSSSPGGQRAERVL